MKQFVFDNNWDTVKGQLKQKYGQLTDDDLTFASGKEDELLGRLRQKLGLSADDLNAQLLDLGSAWQGRINQAKDKASDLADGVKARAGAIADDLKSRAGDVAGQVKDRAAAVGEQARAQASVAYDQARAQASVAYDQARAQATAAYGQARERVGDWQEEGEDYVRQNPREALLGAVCAGFVVGLLLRR